MKAVILAGGLGSRLSEETDRVPKPMVRIGRMPILWHIMKIYSHHGINDFVICLGYKGEVIKQFFLEMRGTLSDFTIDIGNGAISYHDKSHDDWRVTLIDTGDATMTGGRVKRIAPYLDNETFCLTYGDGVADVDIQKAIAFHHEQKRLATVTAVEPPGRFGALELTGDRVGSFSEKIDNKNAYVNGGFFVLEPACLDYITNDATVWEQEPLERLAAAEQLAAYRHKGFWKPMDTINDKRFLEDLWAKGNAPWKVWP